MAVLTAVGCTSHHKVVAARHTDCPYKQLEISDETYEADEETWIASCGERRYLCSTTNINNRVKYRCRPLPPPAPDAGVTP